MRAVMPKDAGGAAAGAMGTWRRVVLGVGLAALAAIVLYAVQSAPGRGDGSEIGRAATMRPTSQMTADSEREAEHRLSRKAVEVTRLFGFPITNSMVATWTVAGGLIAFAQIATRRMRSVPEGAQNAWEWIIESVYNFLAGIIGRHLVERTFWFFATSFIFILFLNWAGLIPGVGTIGWGHRTAHGFVVDQPLLRGANADLNLTLAMSLVFFGAWIVWALLEVGRSGA